MHKESARRAAWVALLLVSMAPHAKAIGDVRYRNPREHVLGVGSVEAALIFRGSDETRGEPGWMVEAGERYLFGIAGLKTTFFRLGIVGGSSGLVVSSVFLSSPVGGERHVSVETYYRRRGRIVLTATTGASVTVFDGFRSARLLTAGVRLAAAVSPSIAVGYSVEEIRVAGAEQPGVDTALYAVAWRDSPVSAVVRLRVDRHGDTGLEVASRFTLGRSLEIAVGYEDRTGSLSSSAGVGLRSLELLAGAAHHPVLGVSRAIFLRWGWGR